MIQFDDSQLRRRWDRSMWLAIVIGIAGAVGCVDALVAFALEPQIWKAVAAVWAATVVFAEVVAAMACDVIRRGAGP